MKFEKTTLEKPEVFQMAGILGIDADSVIGKLLRVWNWFDDQSRDGHAHVTVMSLLDRYTGVTGFVDAMTKVGWMRVDGDSLSLPNFDRHNGEPAKVRALARTRKQRERSNRDNSVTDCVTKTGQSCDKPVTREEKRREENSNTPIVPKGTRKKESTVPTSPEAIALAEIFHRKATTPWTAVEIRKFKSLMPIDPDDLKSLKEYYDDNWPPERDVNVLRHDLKTLLNNFPGEVGRAKVWESKPIPSNPYSAAPLYSTNRPGSLFP